MSETTERDGEGFAALGLDAALVKTLGGLGYEEPTAIQQEAIPPLLEGRDLLGQAATGTGKTAAFALPLLQRIGPGNPALLDPRAVILVPTRELAMQVAEAIHRYGRSLNARVVPIYGGQSMYQQLKALKRGVDVVVATPGRALDHLRRGTLKFDAVQVVVLDEADEMLDMGFAEELDALLVALPKTRQTALFSATIPKRISIIAKQHLHDAVRVTIVAEPVAAGAEVKVREVAYVVERRHKSTALGRILDMEVPTSALVFCRTRLEVDELTSKLSSRGYRAEPLHGGIAQEGRDRVLRRFREGATDVLVATDVAARGLDIENLTHVINFDLPSSADAYTHRIGRTGRAGREGVAITLIEPREHGLLRNIGQLTKRKIAIEAIPTVHDLRTKRLEITRAAIKAVLDEGEDQLERYRVLVEGLAGEHSVLDIAAAAVKVADESREGSADDDVDIPAMPLVPERTPAWRAAPPTANGDGVARLYIGLGRLAGIRPADLVGAIANEGRLDSRAIGAIQIADRFSIVDIPANAAQGVIAALRTAKVRGKPLRPRLDRATEVAPGKRVLQPR